MAYTHLWFGILYYSVASIVFLASGLSILLIFLWQDPDLCPICLSLADFVFFFTCLNSVLNKFVPPALAFCTHSIPTFPVFCFLPLFARMWRDEPSLLIILLFPFQFCYFCQSWEASIRLLCIVFLKGCQVAWLVLKLQLYYNYYV